LLAWLEVLRAPKKADGPSGAIIMGDTGTFWNKVESFEEAGVRVAEMPSKVAGLFALALRK